MANPANGFRLDGKTAAITGAGSGIGRATALRFARAGAVIHAIDVDESSAAGTAKEITELGGRRPLTSAMSAIRRRPEKSSGK